LKLKYYARQIVMKKLIMKNAKPLEHSKFKVELGNRGIVRAPQMAMNGNKS